MKTDSASSVSSAHGTSAMSLSYQTIASEHRATDNIRQQKKGTAAIQDSLETTERQPASRATRSVADESRSTSGQTTSSDNGGLLDVTG